MSMSVNIWTNPAMSAFLQGLQKWPKATIDATRKAMKSTGFAGKKKLAGAIRTNEFGWTGLHPFTISTHPGRKNPLQGLAKFTRYAAREDGMAVKIKFDTSTSPAFGGGSGLTPFVKRAEEGQTVIYSDKVQRKMARMGFDIRKGTNIVVPQRKIFDPFYAAYGDYLKMHFTSKFLVWLSKLIGKK
jgi:hypothetical protein